MQLGERVQENTVLQVPLWLQVEAKNCSFPWGLPLVELGSGTQNPPVVFVLYLLLVRDGCGLLDR